MNARSNTEFLTVNGQPYRLGEGQQLSCPNTAEVVTYDSFEDLRAVVGIVLSDDDMTQLDEFFNPVEEAEYAD